MDDDYLEYPSEHYRGEDDDNGQFSEVSPMVSSSVNPSTAEVAPSTTPSRANSRYNLRSKPRANRDDKNFDYSYQVFSAVHNPSFESIRTQVYKMGSAGIQSVIKELKQMVDKSVWHGVHRSVLSPKQLSSIIRSRMFIKVKSDGTTKSRLVAGGHMQDKSIYEDLSSPTVTTPAVFMTVAIAHFEKRIVHTVDIVGAYLNAKMSENDVFMELDAYLSSLLVELFPTYEEFMDTNGKVYVKLDKALYGCVESATSFLSTCEEDTQ